jgi:CheY-like chemotaxis protein
MTVSILVVDDEPDVAELFRQRFRREARQGTYMMHFASSGEDALSKLNNGVDPQLIVILSDINMPNMDGLELLSQLKASAQWQQIPVIMVTTESSQTKVMQAVELGAAGYIRKPFTAEQIKAKLEGFF